VISETVTVVNHLGMHARAAAKFVHLAGRFQSRIRVVRESLEMDGKSIMGLLLLAAERGSRITISADGADEREAIAALAALVRSGFNESWAQGSDGPPGGPPASRRAAGGAAPGSDDR
jgi:phosphocarrier protein